MVESYNLQNEFYLPHLECKSKSEYLRWSQIAIGEGMLFWLKKVIFANELLYHFVEESNMLTYWDDHFHVHSM